jgi:autotransporter-associated beta strand protein
MNSKNQPVMNQRLQNNATDRSPRTSVQAAFREMRLVALFAALLAATQLAGAGTTTWVGGGADQNWSTSANWTTSGGSTPPGAADTVIFKGGGYPISTNVIGAVDNIVAASTAVSSLVFTNYGGAATNFHTTQINANQTLTVNGLVTVGFSGKVVTDNMSGPGNFTVNNIGGSFDVGGSSGSTETSTLTLADGTNAINASKLSIAESAGNNGRQCTLNLGNGVNVINADAVNAGTGKAQGTIQFAGAGGSLKIRDSTGAGRAVIVLGNSSSSGSSTARGSLLLAGHPADVLASLVEISGTNGSAGSGGATGTCTMDNGTLDATTIRMGENSPVNNTHPSSTGTLTIGGDPTNTATLIVNSPGGPGGGNFVVSTAVGPWTNDSGVFITTLTGAGTFNLNTNGIAQVYCSITEAAPTNNNGTINITGGTLNMEAATNTIGTPSIPIDNVTLDFATLMLSEDGSSLNVAVKTLTLNDTNVVDVAALPPIVQLPTTIPIFTYTSLATPFNLGLGSLPGNYHGFLTNDAVSTISLVITNGTVVVAKQDEWLGGVNNNWDVTTLNWTNAGFTVTNYAEADYVTFDDKANTGSVILLGNQHTPSGVTVTNNVLNYTFSGPGRLFGATSLVKSGTASLTLSESGGDGFAGGIIVHGGTLILDDVNSAISGGLAVDSGAVVQIGNNDARGSLPSGNLGDEGTLVFNRTDKVLLAMVIPGSGALTQSGSGKLSLSAVNTYTGNTTVGGGTLALSGPGSIAGALAIVKNAALDVSASDGTGSHFNALALTNGTLLVSNVLTTASSLSLTNSTISLQADASIGVGGQANIVATNLVAGGTANTIKVASIQNLVLSPPLPIVVPLISYTSATYGGGFNFGLIPPLSVGGYISNDVANSSVDLVITNAPQNITWNGGSSTDNYWSDAANWSGTATAAGDALFFDGTTRLNNTNDTAAGTIYTNITFNSAAGAFKLNGNSINFQGTLLNSSSVTQAVNLGFTLTGNCALDGGGGALAINGGVTNISGSTRTVALAGAGTLNDLWATNSGASGGGQLQFALGAAGGNWTILDGTGTGALVPVGNLHLAINGAASGGEFDFGTVTSAPNVDGGAGSVTLDGNNSSSIETFNLNKGTLKVNSMVMPGSGNGNLNVNGGTLVLGTNSFTGGTGAGGVVLTGTLNSGAIYSTNGGIFQVTARCSGTFTVNGGQLQCGTLQISAGTAASGNGAFNLDGGKLICTNVACGLTAGNGSATFNFNGGTLQANATSATFFKQNSFIPLALNVSTNGAIIDTAGFNDTIPFPLVTDPGLSGSPDGGLTKLGAGTLTLSAVNTYNGNTAVNAGTLLLSGSLGVGDVTVAASGTLAGTGTVGGRVTVNGTIAPGISNTIGTLTVSSNLTVASTGTNAMKLNKTSVTNDVLSVAGTLTYGGTLSLTNLAGTLAAGDSFKMFTAGTYSGAFARLLPATPGTGLVWNTNTLSTDGILRVATPVNTAPTNITAVVSGSQLNLSWPADHTGWRLQVQTNSASVGLRTNWSDVAGSTTVNNVSVTINPVNGCVFYRLIYP